MVELPQQQPGSGMNPGFALPSITGAPMMLPSLASGAQMLPSMNPSMDGDIAALYGQNLIQQNAIQLQELMQLSGDYSASMKRNLADLNSVSGSLQQINQILTGALDGLRSTGMQQQQQSFGPPAPPEGGSGAPAGDQESEDNRTFKQRFTEGRAMVQSRQSVADVTRRMAGRASAALQSQEGHWDLTPDEDGNIHFYDPTGAVTRTSPATEENLAAAAQDGARMRRASGLLGRYASGESLLGGEGGLLGGLGEGALKAAGPIGLAVGVANMGFKQFTSQTEAGTQYRAAYGEDAGRFAISQRAGADLEGLKGYFTGIGFGRSKANYEAAAQQGLTGGQLGEATDFMNDMYSKLGLDTQTSVQAVQIAAQNTNISLSSLRDNIMDVSKAAVDAGKNSEVAVQSFLQVTQQVQQGVTNTAAAPVLAGQLSTAMSQNLATSLNTPQMATQFAGLITQQNIGMIAARTGQDFRTLSQEVATGQNGAPQQIVGQTLMYAIQDICRAGGTSPEALKAYISQNIPGASGLKTLTPEMQMQVLQNFPNLTPSIMVGIFGQYGMQVNPGDATTLFFNTLLSDITSFGQQGSAGGPSGPAQQSGDGSSLFTDGGSLSGYGMKQLGIEAPAGAGSAGAGRAGVAIAAQQRSQISSGPDKDYVDYAKSSGNRDLAVEKLLRNADSVASYAGKDSLADVQFTTADGQGHSLAEILKDPSLLSQFDQGSPYVKSKNGTDVQQVGDWTGFSGDSTAGGSSATAGGLTIGLTPEASRMFNLSGPSTSQSQGVPPVGSVNPSQYAR